jgi:hypothetical protein
MQKEANKGYVMNPVTKKMIKKYVDKFFLKRGTVYQRKKKPTEEPPLLTTL